MNKEKNNTFFLLVFFLSSIFLSLKPALSEKRYQSRNIIGQHGILEMPVAGSINDGEIGFTVSTVGAINQNVLSFQALPRVYGALSYTGVGNTSSSYYENSGYSYWDRGFDLRIDILDESKFLVEFTDAVVKNWKGLKLKYLEDMILVDITNQDPEVQMPFTQDNAKLLVENSQEFDNWLNEVVFDLENFRSKPKGKTTQKVKDVPGQ